MEYIASLSTQTKSFMFSLGFGLIVGVLYDLIRTLRLIITSSPKAVYVADFLFAVAAAAGTFLFCLTVTNGEIRWYIILGEITGFIVYYFSFGVLVMKFTDKSVAFSRKLFFRLIKLVSFPFLYVFTKLRHVFGVFVEKIHKKTQKSVKKSKYHLQINKALLYNLNDRMRLLFVKGNKTKEKK